jgi:hypothetical protein
MVVFLALALAVAVRRHGRSYAAIAGLIAVTSWAVSFGWPTGDCSLAMVLLSDRYAAATTPAEQASYAAGAEVLIALNDAPAMIGVLQTLGLLLVSLQMLRGTFARGLAWLGVATGVIGIASEALRPVLGWTYVLYGLLPVRLAGLGPPRALAARDGRAPAERPRGDQGALSGPTRSRRLRGVSNHDDARGIIRRCEHRRRV